jgi:hypothetical protein
MAKIEYKKEYKSGDKILPGVTTILKNLGWNKDILMAWAAKMSREGKNYREVSTEAAGTGTLAHAMAESYFAGDDLDDEIVQSYDPNQVQKARNSLAALQTWELGSNLSIFAYEVMLISHEEGYGGTADLIFKNTKGGLELADIKTSNGTYADYILQLAAYARAAEETYKLPVERIHILRFGKGVTAAFHHSSWGVGDIEKAFTVFKYLLAIHKLRPEIEELL